MEFRVNEAKQNFAMKLGEGGEAFFVFETSSEVPESLQTSPLVSPALRPKSSPGQDSVSSSLQEPDYLELDVQNRPSRSYSQSRADAELGWLAARSTSELGAVQYRCLSWSTSADPSRKLDSAFPISRLAHRPSSSTELGTWNYISPPTGAISVRFGDSRISKSVRCRAGIHSALGGASGPVDSSTAVERRSRKLHGNDPRIEQPPTFTDQ